MDNLRKQFLSKVRNTPELAQKLRYAKVSIFLNYLSCVKTVQVAIQAPLLYHLVRTGAWITTCAEFTNWALSKTGK